MTHDDALAMPDRAQVVETVVVCRNGRWEVDMVIVFDSGIVRKTVGGWISQQRALVAARWIRRAAQRDIGDIEGPPNG